MKHQREKKANERIATEQRQLRERKIPTAGSHIFQARRNEELYEPDQGSRIEHPWIIEKMVQYFYNVFHGRKDVYARRGKKGGYYPQCANGWSRECPWHNGNSRFCLTSQCPVRRWKPLDGNILRAHLLGMSESGEDAIRLYPLFFERDLLQSQKSIVIESPQQDQNKVDRFVRILSNKVEDGIRIKVIVLDPSVSDYDNEEHILFMILEMRNAGISVITTKEYGSHFAMIDNHLVWYGGMNLLGKDIDARMGRRD